jgi:hypothetical protein
MGSITGNVETRRATSTDYLKHWKTIPNAVKSDPQDNESRERRRENYDQLANE